MKGQPQPPGREAQPRGCASRADSLPWEARGHSSPGCSGQTPQGPPAPPGPREKPSPGLPPPVRGSIYSWVAFSAGCLCGAGWVMQ